MILSRQNVLIICKFLETRIEKRKANLNFMLKFGHRQEIIIRNNINIILLNTFLKTIRNYGRETHWLLLCGEEETGMITLLPATH